MNLTKAMNYLRLGLKYGLILFVMYYLVVFVIFPGAKKTIRNLIPTAEKANLVYGQLPKLKFEAKKLENRPAYELNTKGSRLPTNIPKMVKVYKFEPAQFSYLADKNAQSKAAILGFGDEDLTTDLKSNPFVWTDFRIDSTLTINKDNQEVTMETDIIKNKDKYTPQKFSKAMAEQQALNLFSKLGYIDEMYTKGIRKVTLGRIVGDKILTTTNQDEVYLASVDFYRYINNYLIYGPDPSVGLISMWIQNLNKAASPVNNPMVRITHWTINQNTNALYPILYPDEAWDKVKGGDGIIVSVRPEGTYSRFDEYKPVRIDKILIDKVYLAYYETPEFQEYLQPIYVFDGKYVTRGTEGGLVTIYYPALQPEFIRN